MRGSHSSAFDSELYSSLFIHPEMKQVWSDENLIHFWLEFEMAAALVQAELDISCPNNGCRYTTGKNICIGGLHESGFIGFRASDENEADITIATPSAY